ncbi:glucose 1-dehydrogenase [Acrocarpospora pleiomorpha]|uniref:Glucose 1-dehydrogenase n=1 Tax=Acrocarpospora pleiomorpha TaxID=90975 RepID=A0A5M3XKY9_9ACTN|nr:SDR family oxidoreductase [Acrocarpospora pleiomorpha]GES21552.1 glucose 1-dehydrogenase [Acrocarpospora pleiomorpha]
MSDILSLTGKVGLVTGAGQGVGRQIALHFAEHGAGVVVNDYVLDRAAAVAAEIQDLGGSACAVQADVSDHAGVMAMSKQAVEQFGPIDILVNNAGNAGATPSPDALAPFWETGPDVWNTFFNVNLYGVMNCAASVIPSMIERRQGRIITIISEAGRYGDAGLEAYSAAKAGAAGLTRAMARTLGRHEITANCVAIAATETPAIADQLADGKRLKKIMERYVIRRPGQPNDIANMVLFLASDASSWITGQTYPVNGGFTFAL